MSKVAQREIPAMAGSVALKETLFRKSLVRKELATLLKQYNNGKQVSYRLPFNSIQ